MNGRDWYMITVTLALLAIAWAVAVFFGWIGHIDAVAGCVK